jgi:hypothetical protein
MKLGIDDIDLVVLAVRRVIQIYVDCAKNAPHNRDGFPVNIGVSFGNILRIRFLVSS